MGTTLKEFARSKTLVSLSLRGGMLQPQSRKDLGELKQLKVLDLTGAFGFSKEELEQIRKRLPDCKVTW